MYIHAGGATVTSGGLYVTEGGATVKDTGLYVLNASQTIYNGGLQVSNGTVVVETMRNRSTIMRVAAKGNGFDGAVIRAESYQAATGTDNTYKLFEAVYDADGTPTKVFSITGKPRTQVRAPAAQLARFRSTSILGTCALTFRWTAEASPWWGALRSGAAGSTSRREVSARV
jgi:hypothetical protein